MRVPRIYYDGDIEVGTIVLLPIESSHHLCNVLKRLEQDEVILFNGQSGNYHGHIIQVNKKGVQILIDSHDQINTESALHLNLGQALIKPDHMDLIIQKAVELGVTHITPLITKRSVIKLSGKRMENKLRHWSQIAISGSEQSGRTKIVKVNKPTKLSKWVEGNEQGLNVYLHPQGSKNITDLPVKEQTVNLLIGPEGGFDPMEVAFLQKSNWCSINLGKRILRAETASITMLSILQHRFGDMH